MHFLRRSLVLVPTIISAIAATGDVTSILAEDVAVAKSDSKTLPIKVRLLRSDPLSVVSDAQAMRSSSIEVSFAPLAASPPHRHPGAVIGYVLEGSLEFQIGDRPLQTLRAGETFFEPAMILHKVARNPDKKKRCRILVTMIHPADAKQLTIPEPPADPKAKD